MLKAFFDESGKLSDPKQRVVAVAGFVSTSNKWSDFKNQWRRKLQEYGVSTFHMTDCEAGRQEFEGWDRRKCSNLIRELIPIIKKHVLFGVGAVMTTEDYVELTKGKSKTCSPYARDPYYGAFNYCLYVLLLEIDKRVSQRKKIAIVCDENEETQGRTSDYYNQFRNNYNGGDRLISLTFSSDKDVLPLQAADFLAFETRRQALSKLYSEHWPNWLWNLQLKKNFLFGGYLDREHLKQTIDMLKDKGLF